MKVALVFPLVACAAGALLRNSAESQSLALQAQSQSLDHKIQKYADSPTRDFLKTLRLCAPCKKYERFGEDNDGGYAMCADGLDKGLVAAYSYGINGFDGWGNAIASRLHIPLEEFDCTNAKQPVMCKTCVRHFHNQCILSNNGDAEATADAIRGSTEGEGDAAKEGATSSHVTKDSFKTLTQMLEESGNANAKERSLLLKIDVESAEWTIFAEEPLANLKKFRQIVVEYHWIHEQQKHELYDKAVKKIEAAGFSVTHMHGNNYGGEMQEFGEYSIPNVIEVTYIQSPKKCSSHIPYHLDTDMPNSKDTTWGWRGQEMPDAVLPEKL